MSYPTFVLVTLQEVNGNSCGDLHQRCEWVDNADPPEYRRTPDGDIPYVVLKQVTLAGGVVTWDLDMAYLGSGPCYGFHGFRRTTAEDNPVGNYCKRISATTDCDLGKAAVVDDD